MSVGPELTLPLQQEFYSHQSQGQSWVLELSALGSQEYSMCLGFQNLREGIFPAGPITGMHRVRLRLGHSDGQIH